MKQGFKNYDFYNFFLFILYLFFFTGLIFSLRAVSSITIGLLVLAGLFNYREARALLLKQKGLLYFGLACGGYFFLQLVSSFSFDNPSSQSKEIQLKSSLLFIPVAIMLTSEFISRKKELLLRLYCWLLLLALLFCYLNAYLQYGQTNDSAVFFYHPLVKPIGQHAVYFSIYVFIAIVFLLHKLAEKKYIVNALSHYSLLLFFCVSLLLLSSKIVLLFFLFATLYYSIRLVAGGRFRKAIPLLLAILSLAIVILLFTQNRISDRFRDMFSGDPTLAGQDMFHEGVYFNGIQFRLLQARLVPEILNEQDSWWRGVGAEKAQQLLNEAYRSKKMYKGDPDTGSSGYLGYNTHNQFLESLLRNGIPGLTFFSLLFIILIVAGWQARHQGYAPVIALLSAYACVESVLETQYGLLLFIFFPLFLSVKE